MVWDKKGKNRYIAQVNYENWTNLKGIFKSYIEYVRMRTFQWGTGQAKKKKKKTQRKPVRGLYRINDNNVPWTDG